MLNAEWNSESTSAFGTQHSALQRKLSKLQLAYQCVGDGARRRSRRRLPVGAAHGGKEALLVEILFEHVERLAQQFDSRLAERLALEHLQEQRGVAQRDGSQRQSHRRPHRVPRWPA